MICSWQSAWLNRAWPRWSWTEGFCHSSTTTPTTRPCARCCSRGSSHCGPPVRRESGWWPSSPSSDWLRISPQSPWSGCWRWGRWVLSLVACEVSAWSGWVFQCHLLCEIILYFVLWKVVEAAAGDVLCHEVWVSPVVLCGYHQWHSPCRGCTWPMSRTPGLPLHLPGAWLTSCACHSWNCMP